MKSIKIFFVIFVLAVILGICSNVIAFLLPNDPIHKNVFKSSETFRREGAFPSSIPSYPVTILDNNSDAWMLLMADYEDDDKSIFEKSMGGYYKIYSEDDGLIGQASLTAMAEPVGERIGGYARYWHGWLLALRFLLIFFTYDDIRFIGIIFQYALMISLFLLMQKKQVSEHALGLFAALMIICPIASCISLEYTFIFYISMIASIFILHFHDKFYQKKLYPYIFFIIGISTSYFDFLTYPIVALGIPLIFSLILQEKSASEWKYQLYHTIINSILWGIGYISFWSMKWILASGILKENIILDAVKDIIYRSGNTNLAGENISFFDGVCEKKSVNSDLL